jgi:hypothetical protein
MKCASLHPTMSLVHFQTSEEKSCSFHIHLDGAIFPAALETYAKTTYGFFNDDFDHRLLVESSGNLARLPARQLTLKIEDRLAGKQVQKMCEDISARAEGMGFAGLIQSEYVMTEMSLQSRYTDFHHSPFPFYVHMRKVTPTLGEEFKSHEIHLELLTDAADNRLITELARSGMQVVFGPKEITFTASGNLNEIRKIQDGILSYLKLTQGFNQAKLVVEATVFHSLHRMKAEDTPLVVERVEYLQ